MPENFIPTRMNSTPTEPPLLEVKNLLPGLRGIASACYGILWHHAGRDRRCDRTQRCWEDHTLCSPQWFPRPSEGEIRFRETPIAGMRRTNCIIFGIARTFQVVRPFLEMTVFENVKAAAVFGKPGRRTASEINREVDEILEITGLSPLAHHISHSLTLPERKRLEVARTLATHPKLLLLDEVLAGLNPREVEEAIPFIRSLNMERKISVLMVEHNLRAIMGICRESWSSISGNSSLMVLLKRELRTWKLSAPT